MNSQTYNCTIHSPSGHLIGKDGEVLFELVRPDVGLYYHGGGTDWQDYCCVRSSSEYEWSAFDFMERQETFDRLDRLYPMFILPKRKANLYVKQGPLNVNFPCLATLTDHYFISYYSSIPFGERLAKYFEERYLAINVEEAIAATRSSFADAIAVNESLEKMETLAAMLAKLYDFFHTQIHMVYLNGSLNDVYCHKRSKLDEVNKTPVYSGMQISFRNFKAAEPLRHDMDPSEISELRLQEGPGQYFLQTDILFPPEVSYVEYATDPHASGDQIRKYSLKYIDLWNLGANMFKMLFLEDLRDHTDSLWSVKSDDVGAELRPLLDLVQNIMQDNSTLLIYLVKAFSYRFSIAHLSGNLGYFGHLVKIMIQCLNLYAPKREDAYQYIRSIPLRNQFERNPASQENAPTSPQGPAPTPFGRNSDVATVSIKEMGGRVAFIVTSTGETVSIFPGRALIIESFPNQVLDRMEVDSDDDLW